MVNSADVPEGELVGKWLVADDSECTTGYPIECVERGGAQTKLFTKAQGKGFAIDAADTWRLWHAASMTR